MREPITVDVLVEQLKKLRVAWPAHSGTKTPAAIIETAEVYREGLHGLSADALRAAVKIWIETEKFFPKVSELRGVALEWTRRNTADGTPAPASQNTNELWCRNCKTEVRPVVRYRPAVDDTGAAVFSTDGVWLALETYQRLICECHSPCRFAPEDGVDGLWMHRDRVTGLLPSAPGLRRAPLQFMTDEARRRLEEGLDRARSERARQPQKRDPHELERIGDRAENYAAGVLEHA